MSRKTSCGRRAWIAASASSEFFAVRVAVTLVRQNAGNEFANVGLIVDDQNVCCHVTFTLFLFRPRALQRLAGSRPMGNEKANAGAASRRCIEQFETAAVIFQNLRDDGRPRPVPSARVVI